MNSVLSDIRRRICESYFSESSEPSLKGRQIKNSGSQSFTRAHFEHEVVQILNVTPEVESPKDDTLSVVLPPRGQDVCNRFLAIFSKKKILF